MDQATLVVTLSAFIVGFALAALILCAWSLRQTSRILNENHQILWQKLMLIVVQQFATNDPAAAQQAIQDIARHGISKIDMNEMRRQAEQVRAAREAQARAEAAFQKEQQAQVERNKQKSRHRVTAGFMPNLEDENTEPQENPNVSASH